MSELPNIGSCSTLYVSYVTVAYSCLD